jgi:23S rRNA (guanosine2251-2'-O)-methyltransferase
MSKNPSAYGMHASLAILKNPLRQLESVLIRQGEEKKYQEILDIAQKRNVTVTSMPIAEMNQRYPDIVHQGIIVWAKALPPLMEADLPQLVSALDHPALILILDGVTDPHNLGACLRSADAAGVDWVLIPKDKSASLNPTVTKVSCGASESMPLVRVTNLARSIETLQSLGVWVYGACGEASDSLYELDASRSIALVLGAEGDGLRRLTRERCDGLYSIPMLGQVSSLNVSVAAGVSLYEMRRQRLCRRT